MLAFFKMFIEKSCEPSIHFRSLLYSPLQNNGKVLITMLIEPLLITTKEVNNSNSVIFQNMNSCSIAIKERFSGDRSFLILNRNPKKKLENLTPRLSNRLSYAKYEIQRATFAP
ncbi:hypothetical protein pb186bvf_006438 [Paramecium bursaria]